MYLQEYWVEPPLEAVYYGSIDYLHHRGEGEGILENIPPPSPPIEGNGNSEGRGGEFKRRPVISEGEVWIFSGTTHKKGGW